MELLVLDVRSMLKAKQKPYDLIMQYTERIEDSNVFELHTPFKPSPLYKVLARQQIRHVYYKKSITYFISQFYRIETFPYTYHLDLRVTPPAQALQQVHKMLKIGSFSDTVVQIAAWISDDPANFEQLAFKLNLPFTVGIVSNQRCLIFRVSNNRSASN